MTICIVRVAVAGVTIAGFDARVCMCLSDRTRVSFDVVVVLDWCAAPELLPLFYLDSLWIRFQSDERDDPCTDRRCSALSALLLGVATGVWVWVAACGNCAVHIVQPRAMRRTPR